MSLSSKMTFNNKVDFIISGTQKGGTTALDTYLREHSDICMASKKEVHFFDKDVYFTNNLMRKVSHIKYHSYFKPLSNVQLVGEATPIYMYWHDAPKRMWEYNPDMKIILILRSPIERAYSQWNMEKMKGKDQMSFWDAIHNEENRSREALPLQHRVYSYIDRGFYTEQIKRIWHYFPKEQTLIIKNEDLKSNPHKTLEHVFNFLNVPILEGIAPKNVHSRPYTSSLSIKEFEYLKNVFYTEIKALEKLLNWDCSQWLEYPNTQSKG